mgnify:CR=1 FL=1
MLRDKGYNGTPYWTMVANPIASFFSTSSLSEMRYIASIDWIFLLVMFGMTWWAFGLEIALLMACLILTNYAAFHGTLKSAFMRLDWVASLVATTCLLKKGYYRTAGVAASISVVSRVFPAAFLFGIAAYAVWFWLREKRLHRQSVQFFVAFSGAVSLLLILSLLYTGTNYWESFIAKIAQHRGELGAWRVGLKYVFLFGGVRVTLGRGPAFK